MLFATVSIFSGDSDKSGGLFTYNGKCWRKLGFSSVSSIGSTSRIPHFSSGFRGSQLVLLQIFCLQLLAHIDDLSFLHQMEEKIPEQRKNRLFTVDKTSVTNTRFRIWTRMGKANGTCSFYPTGCLYVLPLTLILVMCSD